MSDVQKVSEGYYRLKEGEDDKVVAAIVYGSQSYYLQLISANPYSKWEAGDVIRVPNKKGRVTTYTDDSMDSLLKRMFPGQPTHLYLPLLLKWNADDVAHGDTVFVPER